MHDPDGAAGQLAALKELGIRITIDDFGTATSDESAAIVHSLVQLGKTLGLETLGALRGESGKPMQRLPGSSARRGLASSPAAL
jgi:EAL domain-containing protein (putative c-di-GMP-specific phosphodiesterase class I)